MIFYPSSRAAGRLQSGPANLENDTEKKRTNIKDTRNRARTADGIPVSRTAHERSSEDSKEFNIERCLRIKRKSLILAQDERWRRA